MSIIGVNVAALLPTLVLILAGMAIMVADPFATGRNKGALLWAGLGGVFAAGLALRPMSENAGTWYAGLWRVDSYTLFFHALLLLIAGLTILTSIDYLNRESVPKSEFVVLVLLATSGALLMSGAAELMLMFIGIEILSIGTYILAGYRRGDLRSNESALKYFLLGSFASAFFLYGVALVFGATRSTHLDAIRSSVDSGAAAPELVYLGFALMIIGLGFKVALAPFHIWAPDVYEGAPTPVTAFMSAGPKAAGFAVLMRILFTAFPGLDGRWVWLLWVMAALTMLVGNLAALVQPGMKRMLAYSSIAHAGYVGVALATGIGGDVPALFYLLAYSVTSLGAFSIVVALGRPGDANLAIKDYRGLGWRRPGLAAMLALFLLSLAGIPATAGFTGKFLIFRQAVSSGLTGLAVLGVLTTVVSFYYYLYVIVEMYMREPVETFDDVVIGKTTVAVIVVSAALTLYLGILPEATLEWVTRSAVEAVAIR